MGFSLKAWASHALKVPKEFRKINVGHTLANSAKTAISGIEGAITKYGQRVGSVGNTVDNVNEAATSTRMLPWIIGAGLLLVVIVIARRR